MVPFLACVVRAYICVYIPSVRYATEYFKMILVIITMPTFFFKTAPCHKGASGGCKESSKSRLTALP